MVFFDFLKKFIELFVSLPSINPGKSRGRVMIKKIILFVIRIVDDRSKKLAPKEQPMPRHV
jgi:hypothetical protein